MAAQPTLVFFLAVIAMEPLSGWPLTNTNNPLRATGMSLQVSQMLNPSLRCGRRSLRWLISLIAKIMVCIQRRARELKLG